MKALARWSSDHPLLVVLLWLLTIVGMQVAAQGVGSDYRNSFALPGTGSQAAVDLLDGHFPEASNDADTIVLSTDGGAVTDEDVQARAQTLFDDVAALESVAAVRSPYGQGGAAQISPDATMAYASVQYQTAGIEVPRHDLETLVDLVEDANGDGLEVAVGGQGVAGLTHPQIGPVELIGVAFAALVLLLLFRSPVAMVLPIASAAAALGVATAAVRLISNVTTVSDVAPTLGVLLGLGVGIDYALFIVNRYRTGLRSGLPVQDAIITSLDTSGRAVVFAGITVVIALLGLFLPGVEFLYGLAIAATVSVILTVLAATTLLPAFLGLLGLRVLGRRDRRNLARGRIVPEEANGAFRRWAGVVRKRPVLLVLAGLITLLVIAIPATDLRLGTADQGNDPAGTTTREAYDMLAAGFGPGINGPLVVAVDLTDAPLSGGDPSPLMPLVNEISADPAVASVVGPMPSEDGTAAVLRVVPTTSPQDQVTNDLINRIRDDLAPAYQATTDAQVWVGGPTATFDDFATTIQDKIPLFVSVVIGLSFLLLVLAFRSLLVPLVGAVMNLVSVAAAFGVVVAVFQRGWAADLIGLGKEGPIEPFLPVILFAMLFGLSMDYQVFLVSRMREEWSHHRNNSDAIHTGHATTGKVIIAAASIMVFVFGAFIFGDSRTIKLLGLGMSAAVLLDAFIIRMLIVPALMHRIGPANWWLPRWLDRALPHVSIEGGPAPAAAQPARALVPAATGDDDGRARSTTTASPQARSHVPDPLADGAQSAGGATSRPAPMDEEPGARLAQALLLMEQINRAASNLRPLQHTVERVTGLSPAQALILMDFAPGQEVSFARESETTTLRTLAQQGLVTSSGPQHSTRSRATGWRLTPAGQATAEQLQGLRIRITNAVLVALDDDQVHALQTLLNDVGEALEHLSVHAD